MDASLLAKDLDNLEKSWSSLDWWLNAWTIIVVVGVAVELLVIITEYAHDWRDFKRGTIHTPEKPSILIFGLGFLGAALVAIGVAGEFRIHVKAGKIESDMRSKSRELVGIAQHDAGDANKKAGDANRDAAQLRKDAEGLKKQAEDERLARVKIERQLQPRRLTPHQQSTISILLAPYAGKNVEVQSYTSDIEAAILAEQIAEALRVAQVTVRDSIATINAASLPILFGVHVDTNSPDRESARGIAGILRGNSSVSVSSDEVKYGQGTLRFIAPGPRPDVIILVGVKPLKE